VHFDAEGPLYLRLLPGFSENKAAAFYSETRCFADMGAKITAQAEYTLPLTPPKYTYVSCSLEVGSRVRGNVLHLRKCINHLH
jgi:hypothetical protein